LSARFPVLAPSLQLVGTLLEILGTSFMVWHYLEIVKRGERLSFLFSAFSRKHKERVASADVLRSLNSEDFRLILRGLVLLFGGFVLQGIGTMLSLL
jgi:hypothetical protein